MDVLLSAGGATGLWEDESGGYDRRADAIKTGFMFASVRMEFGGFAYAGLAYAGMEFAGLAYARMAPAVFGKVETEELQMSGPGV